MKKLLLIIAALSVPAIVRADIGANQQVQLEAQIQQRVQTIVAKGDKQALVQVRVDVKRMSSVDLPGVWTQTQDVTPVTKDGQLAMEGIDKINVRVVTQVDKLPQWIQDEVKQSLNFGNLRVETKYEKAKGKVDDEAKVDSTLDTIKQVGKDLADGLSKVGPGETGKQVSYAIWGLVAGLVFTMILLCAAIFVLGRKIEGAFFRVVDEKLAPLMQAQAAAAGRRSRSSEEGASASKTQAQAAAATSGGTNENEFSSLSAQTIFALIMDCYWTQSDSYAHFVWTKLSPKQRDELLASKEFGAELFRYFQFVRQFPPENLGYHLDVQYVETSSAYSLVDQKDLAKHVTQNPSSAAGITPLRWDNLPISLSDRLKATLAMNSSQDVKPLQAAPLKASALRTLPRRLEVKTLSAEDEGFLWTNPKMVSPDLRSSLKTLVWLALCSKDVRESVLGEFDARDLAEAWVGPDAVLAKLQEAIPAKKFDLVKSYLKETQPDRQSPVFEYLVSAGAEKLSAQDSGAGSGTSAEGSSPSPSASTSKEKVA